MRPGFKCCREIAESTHKRVGEECDGGGRVRCGEWTANCSVLALLEVVVECVVPVGLSRPMTKWDGGWHAASLKSRRASQGVQRLAHARQLLNSTQDPTHQGLVLEIQSCASHY